ncbi:MAG TPA: hypothetical protein VFH73_05145 [Polyangia bacterium]|nr:hypothetical protein [Polyangia bacterium]
MILLGGCETRIVDLRVPVSSDAGGPGPGTANVPTKCETVTHADGSKCEICYSAAGMVVSTDCASGMPAVDAATPGGTPSPCKVVPMDDTRCALCPTAGGMVVMGCLKCDVPVKTTTAGDFCRTCAWSDLMAGQCLQCYTADGTPTLDDCDALRSGATTTPP